MTIGAGAIWRVRTTGNEANGGGYDPTLAGAGTDYSQQSLAQLSMTGSLTTSGAGSTTLTDGGASGLFTSQMVGNAIFISAGNNFDLGAYFITAFTDANNIVLDRTPTSGGAGSVGWGKIGGAWAGFTNILSAYVVPGNTVYFRGTGSASVASPDYTMPSLLFSPNGSTTDGYVKYLGENGTNGYVYIKAAGSTALMWYQAAYCHFEGIYFIANGTTFNSFGMINGTATSIYNCKFDQNGNDTVCLGTAGIVSQCEVFSSTAVGGGALASIASGNYGLCVEDCNIHDTVGPGVALTGNSVVSINNNIIAKCNGNGITVAGNAGIFSNHIHNNTIDGNTNGIELSDAESLMSTSVKGNFITNHNQALMSGIYCATGTTTVNDKLRGLINGNWFYNNTADASNLTVGTSTVNGTVLKDGIGVDPGYTHQSTQDYSLTSVSAAKGIRFPNAAFLQSVSGQTTGVRSHADVGAVQTQETGGSGGEKVSIHVG